MDVINPTKHSCLKKLLAQPVQTQGACTAEKTASITPSPFFLATGTHVFYPQRTRKNLSEVFLIFGRNPGKAEILKQFSSSLYFNHILDKEQTCFIHDWLILASKRMTVCNYSASNFYPQITQMNDHLFYANFLNLSNLRNLRTGSKYKNN